MYKVKQHIGISVISEPSPIFTILEKQDSKLDHCDFVIKTMPSIQDV